MITISAVTKQMGKRVLYENASFQINPGDRIGLVGPNGAGKTTFFRMIMKEESPETGSIGIPSNTVVGYFSQNVADMHGTTALQEVMSAAGRVSVLAQELKHIEKQLEESGQNPISDDKMAELLEEYGSKQQEFEAGGGYSLEALAQEILTGLGISPSDHLLPVETFSGGWKMRIQLAKILVLQPDVLLMDEPTNHLDLESIVWLEDWLQKFPGSIMMTSHDRDFMNRLVKKIVEIAHKKVTVYGGNYDFYEKESEIRREQLLSTHKRQQDMLAKEEEFIARFQARASHAAQVQSRVKKLDKIDRIEIPPEEEAMKFTWPVPERGGDEVIKFQNLSKVWAKPDGTKKLVFENASGLIKRGDRVAVVGVNGAGKSTLLKIFAGQAEPTSGECVVGNSISVGYFSQSSLDVLHPQKTLLDEVHDLLPNASIGYIRSLLGAFKFSGEEAEKKVMVLSGGEKSRLVLATMLTQAPNCLILDEPTNHLDIKSREVLLNAIKGFPGTVVMVSHDRYFLREVANRVFEVDKSRVTPFDMTYDEYVEKRKSV
ncbi:MAG: glycosyl transferase family 1 [Bdellovibrionales bacterium CG10_big_fil_rev_8_21_14_0_10_45_34]|nr:MAG: glycosyl transferase family 1 [Bdellovibrionales bacterium CG10_big_fil_rev_8_21_14_0_10_45_34]